MKKKLLGIILIALACLLFFYILLFISNRKPSSGFDRNLVALDVKISQTLQLPHNLFGLPWKSTEEIWLIDYKSPLALQKISSNLRDLEVVKITTPANFLRSLPHMYYDKFGSNLYITNKGGDIAKLSRFSPVNYHIPNLNFDAFCIISPNSVIVRSFVINKGQRGTELDKLTLTNHHHSPIEKKYLLPKQGDGIFSCDGSIYFDHAHARFFYMYYRRGEFLCLDSNLKLVYQAKTIDTVRFARLKLAQYSTNVGTKIVNKSAIVSPPNLVNKSISVDGDRIYIHSGLKGDNESPASSSQQEAIDVYALKNGKYVYSFYLPRFKSNALGEFKVYGHTITAIYGNYLVKFTFRD